MADKGYDGDAIVGMAREAGMEQAMPPRRNRREQRRHGECLYRLRHLVENAFAEMKRWRGIATRYAKNPASCPAVAHFRCIIVWAEFY
jgi:transposase